MASTASPSPAEHAASQESAGAIWPIVRDVLIFCLLTTMGGFVVSYSLIHPTDDPSLFRILLGATAALTSITAFIVAGINVPAVRRWSHLLIVGAICWLYNAISIPVFGYTVSEWLWSIIPMAAYILLGGVFSYLFKRSYE